MSITISQAQGKVPITILALQGDLDASNFQDVIVKAKDVYQSGGRYILLDMSGIPFMSSSGLVALHSVAILFQGKQPPDLEHGWEAFHSIDRDREGGLQRYVKLFDPQPRVSRTLEVSGMTSFFEIHTNLQSAIASFG